MMYRSKLYLLVLLCLLTGFVQAGGQIDFTPHGTQPGLNFTLDPPTDCHSCHEGNLTTDDKVNMPYATWMGSMKANATRDPLFWAALDVANNDLPGVGDFCLKCHSPQGWYEGHVVKPVPQGSPLVDGANGCELQGDYTSQDSKNSDFGGINCHFCHRIDEKGPNDESLVVENGNLWIDDQNCDNGFGPCRKGPYGDADYNDGGSTPPHAWQYSSFIQSGKFCGSCHNISSPTVEQNGELVVINKFWHEGVETELPMPVERTYSEWQQSYFADLIFKDPFNDLDGTDLPVLAQGENCQTCHMPDSESIEARACVFDPLNGKGEGRRIGDLPTHQFAGGNTWIPQVLKTIYGDALEANDPNPGRKEAFDLTTSYAFNMLQVKSAVIETTLVNQSTDELNVNVKVTNLTGHKLPTGYPEGRRMWIYMEAKDGGNNTIWQSGAYDVATGVLTEDAQLKVYESLQGIWNEKLSTCEITDNDGDKMFHFAKNNCIAKDNRIPPLGFTGASDIELQPVGITYPAHPNNPNQVVNYDTTGYQIPITGLTGPFTVTATLKYQVASKDYIDFLDKQATVNNFETENQMCDRSWTVGAADQTRGAYMKTLWENNNRSEPVSMVMDLIEVNLP